MVQVYCIVNNGINTKLLVKCVKYLEIFMRAVYPTNTTVFDYKSSEKTGSEGADHLTNAKDSAYVVNKDDQVSDNLGVQKKSWDEVVLSTADECILMQLE